MKIILKVTVFAMLNIISFTSIAQTRKLNSSEKATGGESLFIDVHQLAPGKVKFKDVAAAHAKDLATQKKYGAHFVKYWVNEEKGLVYCLVSAPDSESLRKTHAEAHGLMPDRIYKVTGGVTSAQTDQKDFFFDVHNLGAGNVNAKAVAEAHKKDLATQHKYGVNFINYWVDEQSGTVMCLSQASDSTSVIRTHKEAHGLLPAYVVKVKQGE